MKRRFSDVLRLSLVVSLVAIAANCGAQGSSPSTASQQVLNLLAAPAASKSPSYGLPPSFSGWSPDQQRTVPTLVEGRCGVLWTMMNAGGKLQLLPATEDPQDNAMLALDACVVSKMPSDWPPGRVIYSDMERILARSNTLGGTLSMPPTLVR
jgi:hypothetical protein